METSKSWVNAMNAPMKQPKTANPIKEIYGKSKGFVLPPKIVNLLVGAELRWEDKNPLSQNMDDCLHFFFDSHTKPQTDMLLRRYGFADISQYVNLNCRWQVHMELFYATPNNKEKSHHIDHHWFEFRGTIFPLCDKFKTQRDAFYMARNLEHTMVPEDNKNKGYYQTAHFDAVIIGA